MPDSITVAEGKIAQKIAELRQRRFDIGASRDTIKDAGYGGYYQDFLHGRIYTHHAVGTYEVHGGILQKFLTRNGIDHNPAMQRRELGFPRTDEHLTPEGYPVSIFEWGEIIFFPGTNGGVALSGEIYRSWKSMGPEGYGYPVTSNHRKGRYEYCFFERGFCIQVIGQPNVYWASIYYPLLGNAAVLNLASQELPITMSITKSYVNNLGGESELIPLLNEHLVLEQVSDKGRRLPLFVTAFEDRTSLPTNNKYIIRFGCKLQAPRPMRVKGPTLYNLSVKNENNAFCAISPHAVYHRPDWVNFGLLHATDIHVARRIDHFKNVFRSQLAKYPQHASLINGGINSLNNWNNGFRDFIRYANALYRKGIVDGIIATGDIVDYLFEEGEFKDGGGNFKFLRDLILGHSPYPDREHDVEELLVPIFITLGNHDYRVNPYLPYARLDISLYPDKDLPQYSGYNLTKGEVRVLQGGNPGNFDDDDEGRTKISTDTGKAQVIPATKIDYWDKDHLAYYKRYINRSSDFVVPLGNHKIVMIDSGPDVGAPDGNWDTWDAVTTALGFGDTDEVAFQVRKSPNCVGPSDASLNHLRNIQAEDGIVIVGIHAPPLNIFRQEYSHYFRETEHSTIDRKEIVSFLFRCSPGSFSPPGSPVFIPPNATGDNLGSQIAGSKWPNWFTQGTHFKAGSPLEFLHNGVSRKDIMLFLNLICGREGSGKAIDLLLTGHDHCMSEIRIRPAEGNNGFLYFTDFYSENPQAYHSSFKYKEHIVRYEKVAIEISSGAPPNGTPRTEGNVKVLAVPPYANPLNEAGNKQEWWNQHKPLLIQGAPLGPTDHNNRELDSHSPSQFSFEGCKLIVIRNNVIDKIVQVSRAQMAQRIPSPPAGVSGISFGVGPELGPTIDVRDVMR